MKEGKHKIEINILIIDDHKMLRDGLRVMLESMNKTHCFTITEAENGEDGIRKITKASFDMVIMDYQMPDFSGAETIYKILRFKPLTKILALSNYDELAYVQSMIDAGAKGYVLKNIEPVEMLNAIKTVLSGRIYYCSEVAVKLIDSKNQKNIKKEELSSLLTKREIEVLRMIAMEMTNDEISKKLFVAKRTVDTHRQNLLNKLQVRNTVGLLKVAFKSGLIKQ